MDEWEKLACEYIGCKYAIALSAGTASLHLAMKLAGIEAYGMCKQVRGEQDVCYIKETGKTCPTEILEAIASINAEGRPVWKPMHISQFIYIFGRYWSLQFLLAFHRHILNMNFTYSGLGKHFLYIMTMRC